MQRVIGSHGEMVGLPVSQCGNRARRRVAHIDFRRVSAGRRPVVKHVAGEQRTRHGVPRERRAPRKRVRRGQKQQGKDGASTAISDYFRYV